jgi:type IV secretory pathway VirB3-like protein
LNHTSHFTSYHLKFIIEKIATLVYLIENLNLKYELLNYYFHLVKDLIRKNHNSRYIEILVTKTFSKNPPSYQCYYMISPLIPLLIKKHYMKVHGVHIHQLWIVKFLGTFLKAHYVMTIQKLSMKFI